MHPAPSIIIFTVLSGIGFGMFAYIGFDLKPIRGWEVLPYVLIAFFIDGWSFELIVSFGKSTKSLEGSVPMANKLVEQRRYISNYFISSLLLPFLELVPFWQPFSIC